jgi:hypothetical protein
MPELQQHMKAIDFSTGSIFLLPSSSLAIMADAATFLGSIPATSDTV